MAIKGEEKSLFILPNDQVQGEIPNPEKPGS